MVNWQAHKSYNLDWLRSIYQDILLKEPILWSSMLSNVSSNVLSNVVIVVLSNVLSNGLNKLWGQV